MDDQTVLAGSQPQASLVVRQGDQVGTTYPIIGNEVYIGREEGIDISIRDPEVSRRHARISWQSGSYYLEDLGSTNGTFLNNSLVTSPQELRSGDTVGLGQSLFVFQTQVAAMPAQAAAEPIYADSSPPVATPGQAEQKNSGSRCLLWGCGCLVVLGFLMGVLTLVVIVLFAEAIQPVFDDLGIPIQLTMQHVTHLLV